jgi:hypothetical protein
MNLTREQILAMPAGREMDALVAERVMEIRVYWHHYYLTGDGKLTKCGPFLNGQDSCESVNRKVAGYSTDISAAWRVVEKMRDALGHWELAHHIDDPRKCYAEFGGEYEPYDGWHTCKGCALADTAPLAICRAALLATLEPQ